MRGTAPDEWYEEMEARASQTDGDIKGGKRRIRRKRLEPQEEGVTEEVRVDDADGVGSGSNETDTDDKSSSSSSSSGSQSSAESDSSEDSSSS